jgi:hypothetical protein
MGRMVLVPIYQAPRTSQPHPEHRICPYLLRGMAITRPIRIWMRAYDEERPHSQLGGDRSPMEE